MAIDEGLSALRKTRGQRSEKQTAKYLDNLAASVIAASGQPLPEAGDDPLAAMLTERPCERIACATLLRLLVFDDDAFTEDVRLRRSTALFDRVLARNLYPLADLTPKSQSFEKRDGLRILVAAHEEALVGHVKSLNSLDGMGTFRGDLKTRFSTEATRAFILPFLPEGVTDRTFEELLNPVHRAAKCADTELINQAEAVERRCSEFADMAEQSGTHYSKVFMADLASTAQRLVRVRIAEAGLADPAQLSVALRPKRYPFGYQKVPVTIRVDLTNEGPGQARDVIVEIEGGGAISYDDTVKTVGQLSPGTRRLQFHGLIANGSAGGAGERSDLLGIKVSWRNPDGEQQQLDEVKTLREQPGDVLWDELTLEQPYRLEPVKDPDDFVGREAAVRTLSKVVLQSGNARIEGEKRVGKTSLAFAVNAMVEKQQPGRYAFLQLESGDFTQHTAEATVARLGEMIADRVRKSDDRLRGLPKPDFGSGLSTLTELFAEAQTLAPEISFVVVLDEFDELPHADLYKHEPVGHAFFQTLRSLGGKSNVGFLLIGGERMQWVISVHGTALNKFKLVPVDYFDEEHIDDYAQLVRAPVAGRLDFSEDAIDALYTASAGNPWMTKLLLGELFERQVERRDRDVQVDDVADAIAHALPKFGAENFQHFWDDAIRGEAEDREYVSATRRRVLLALSRCLRGPADATDEAIVTEAANFSVDEITAREVIQGLLERSILRIDEHHVISCRVPLFEQWLAKYGAQQIILGTGDDDTLIRKQRSIEELRPTVEELITLAKRWKTYKGEDLRPEQIGAWLEQFGGPKEQRLAMPVLEGLRFYTRRKIAERLREAHQFVLRELASRGYEHKITGKQRMRSDFLVCGLEGGGSGAAHLLKPYRDENGIYAQCAVDSAEVRTALDAAKQEVRAVVVIDDFVGTGATAASRLRALHEIWTAESEWPESVDVFFLAICAFESGLSKVKRALDQLDWPVTTWVYDLLGDEDRCFHEDSAFYEDANEREQAQALFTRFGQLVSAKTPLGYGKTEAALCFEYRCPNNSLPVLWSRTPDWDPLFPRL